MRLQRPATCTPTLLLTFDLQGVASFPQKGSEDLLMALGRWTVAFAKTCKLHLRENGNLEADMQGVLKPFELQMLQGAAHRPLKALQV